MEDQLKAEKKVAPIIRANADGSISRKSFNTLLKIVGGIAISCYGYDPSEKKSDVIATIQTDLALKGIELDADTIRKWVKEGVKHLTLEDSENSN